MERGQRKEAETQLTQSRTQLSQEKTEMERYIHVYYITTCMLYLSVQCVKRLYI